MAYETFVPLFHEIFTKVNNAKDKTKKMEVLRKYQTPALEQFLKAAFDPNIEWLLPEGDVPSLKMTHQMVQTTLDYLVKLLNYIIL